MQKIRILSFLLCLNLGLSGCASLMPYLMDFNIISVPQEIQLGNKFAEQIAAEMTVIDDEHKTRTVEVIGGKLAAALPQRDFEYRFYVVEDKTPNAFTIPGGHIYVHTGLMDFVDGPHELAGVIAHEIGHAYERHPAKSLSRAYGMDVLSQMLFKSQESLVKQMALGLAKGGVLMKYGREDEHESDTIGYHLLKRAGYSPDGLLKFLMKLQMLQSKPHPLPFLSTHPPTPDRIVRLQELASQDSGSGIPVEIL